MAYVSYVDKTQDGVGPPGKRLGACQLPKLTTAVDMCRSADPAVHLWGLALCLDEAG